MTQLASALSPASQDFQTNRDAMQKIIADYKEKLAEIQAEFDKIPAKG